MLQKLKEEIREIINRHFEVEVELGQIMVNPTNKEFEGAYTLVVFPLVKLLRDKPEALGTKIGEALLKDSKWVIQYNVIKGFLNLSLNNDFWIPLLRSTVQSDFGQKPDSGKKFMIEFCSPNTNKPIHLGHIRNILLGWSMAELAMINGYDTIKTQIINDRGIAICKSMMAWQKTGNGATPSTTNIKGDHFVGKYYVSFEKLFQEEYASWQQTEEAGRQFENLKKDGEEQAVFFKRYKNTYFNEFSLLGKETKQMLIAWEEGNSAVVELWKKMNGWVYEGFEETFNNLGINFDFINYESETYLLGKKSIEQGLASEVFYQKSDNSVWIDLEDAKMDHKLVLRSDGTSVYMTQDIGTAQQRYIDHKMDKLVYVVADEQDYHFKVLFEILKRLGEPYAENLHHLSYGMVDLPTGKMKSREGTVVDADDLMKEVINEAKLSSEERGGIEGIDQATKESIYQKVGMGALKYFIIKVNPKKRMTFDPKESVDMQGQTGPYIQNAFVRIKSIFRRYGTQDIPAIEGYLQEVSDIEQDLIVLLNSFPHVLEEAFEKYDPSLVANFSYSLAKGFHRFYHDCPILHCDIEHTKIFRLNLSKAVSQILEKAMKILGIAMPEYM